MAQMDRRGFMKLAGAGSVVAAAAAGVPLVSHLASSDHGVLTFRAAGGLPEKPLPSYATHLVDGTIDLAAGSGVVTSRVVAGHPDDVSMIGLPGLSRVIKISKVDVDGKSYRLRGVVEDRSQLRRGESANVEIIVDQARNLVHLPFAGRPTTLPLA
jgi:hypothetical protein